MSDQTLKVWAKVNVRLGKDVVKAGEAVEVAYANAVQKMRTDTLIAQGVLSRTEPPKSAQEESADAKAEAEERRSRRRSS